MPPGKRAPAAEELAVGGAAAAWRPVRLRAVLRLSPHEGVAFPPAPLPLLLADMAAAVPATRRMRRSLRGPRCFMPERVASAIVLLLTAFRMAWPAFAYSIEDDREAQRTYSFVLTYVVFVCCCEGSQFCVALSSAVPVLPVPLGAARSTWASND